MSFGARDSPAVRSAGLHDHVFLPDGSSPIDPTTAATTDRPVRAIPE
eukprot:COSAG02_NODE_659_length_18772_cov_14.955015_2_plen_47_part_00